MTKTFRVKEKLRQRLGSKYNDFLLNLTDCIISFQYMVEPNVRVRSLPLLSAAPRMVPVKAPPPWPPGWTAAQWAANCERERRQKEAEEKKKEERKDAEEKK